MNTVVIVGVGLIGGSFGLAIRKAGFAGFDWTAVSPSAVIAPGTRTGHYRIFPVTGTFVTAAGVRAERSGRKTTRARCESEIR